MEHSSFTEQISPEAAYGKASVVPYASDTPIVKEMSRLTQNMISLITEGEKIIYSNGEPIHVTPDTVLMLSAGGYIFTERFAGKPMLKSTMLLFDNDSIDKIASGRKTASKQSPYVFFPRDTFIKSYIATLEHLLADGHTISQQMAALKVNEMLLYLSDTYPDIFYSFQPYTIKKTPEETIKKAVEQNISNFLTVKQLAFLCNMSIPTFKRQFYKVYGSSPAKWMQERRLEIAAGLISIKSTKPGDLYLTAGYNSHSAFSQAFKSYYGVAPKDYNGEPPLQK